MIDGERRKFLAGALGAAAGTIAIESAASATPERPGVPEDVFEELFRGVARQNASSDRIHRLKVLALIHARQWADAAGIKFEWRPEPPHVTCGRCGEQFTSGVATCRHLCDGSGEMVTHEHTWRCQSTLDGQPLEWCGDWGDPSDAATILCAEGAMAVRFIDSLAGITTRDEQCNRRFVDADGGRVVYVD